MDDSNVDVEKVETHVDDIKETDSYKESCNTQVSKNWEIIEDHVSFKYVDESQAAFQPLEVKDLADMLVPLPGQRGGGQIKKYTDI